MRQKRSLEDWVEVLYPVREALTKLFALAGVYFCSLAVVRWLRGRP